MKVLPVVTALIIALSPALSFAAKGYWMISASNVTDQDAQKEYINLWKTIAEKYNAKLIPPPKSLQVKEIGQDKKITLIEFPTYKSAIECYEDADYKKAKEFALKASKRDLVIFEGDVE